MNLFNKKNDLINQIFDVTKEAYSFLSDNSFEDYNKVNEILKRRQDIILEIDALDEQIRAEKLSVDDYPEIKESIKITLEGINSLNEKIEDIIKIQSDDIAAEIKSLKQGRKGLNMNKSVDVTGFKLDISK